VFGAHSGTLDAQELRFHAGDEGKPGRVSKKLGRNGKCFPPSRRRPAAAEDPADPARLKKPTLLPGSDGEHALQAKYCTKERANGFYGRQVLSFLSPLMRDFISRQEFLFVATSDRHGECDCPSKFGEPGFIRVLSEKYLAYPEYRGNGVFANLGNISENPHIAMLILDFFRDSVGLHVNGKARIIERGIVRLWGQDTARHLGRVGERREKTAGALDHGRGGGSLHPMLQTCPAAAEAGSQD
jgi:predicted pyridoxine 5'-phosphate oxidase superfamily flavin-nucleotide-binding protein